MQSNIEFDGYTVVLNATMNVVPGETYAVKIAIADVGDGVFDSGVFIGIESLGGNPNLTPPAAFDFNVVDNELAITNNSRYATSYLWDFGDGSTSTEQMPPAHIYNTNEYTEYTVTLITQNYCCSDTFTTTVAAFPTVNVVDPALKNLVLSPNPATDAFSFIGINRSVNVFAYDALGRLVWTNRVGTGEVVSLEEWNRGVYTLKIVGEDPERPMIQKLLVQ